MLNIIEILFLVFGWIYSIKKLIVASLVISAVFMFISFAEDGKRIRAGNKRPYFKLGLLIQIVCFCLSSIKLCI